MSSPRGFKFRKRYLEPDAALHEAMPRSTANHLSNREPSSSQEFGIHNSEDYFGYTGGDGMEPSSSQDLSTHDSEDYSHHTEDDGVDAETNATAFVNTDFALEFVTPLQSGGEHTVGDALDLLLDFAIKHGLTWTGTEDLLKLVNSISGTRSLPESKHPFRKFVGASTSEITFHFYCPDCENFLQDTSGDLKQRQAITPTCSVCKTKYTGRDLTMKGSIFVSLPLKTQLESLLSDGVIQENLVKRLNDPDLCGNVLSDVTDGKLYKQKRKDLSCGKHDLTFSMNADGSPMFKSSDYSIWPVQITLNEQPPYLR